MKHYSFEAGCLLGSGAYTNKKPLQMCASEPCVHPSWNGDESPTFAVNTPKMGDPKQDSGLETAWNRIRIYPNSDECVEPVS